MVSPKILPAPTVFSLNKQPLVELALSKTAVGDVWGIGRKYKKLLLSHDITTAYELSRTSDLWIRKHMGITGHRIVAELRGLDCAPVEQVSATKKGLTCSRSFGHPVVSLAELKEAVALYMSRAAEKLRRQQSCASYLTVFIRTSRFRDDLPQHSDACHMELPAPSEATPVLLRYALQAVERLFREGCAYSKAGVILTGLVPASQVQTTLFDADNHERLRAVSEAVDSINRKMGSDTVYHAAAGNKRNRSWSMRRAALSPSYTTRWKDIPVLAESVSSGSQAASQ
jgi:DNA polymerase V